MSLGCWRIRKSRSGSKQGASRPLDLDTPTNDAADLQSPSHSRPIGSYVPGRNTGDIYSSPDYVRPSRQLEDSNSIPQGSSSVPSTSGSVTCSKRTRGRTNPHNLIPKEGDPPFLLQINLLGPAVGDNATKWGKYVAEEASQYHRFPLHKKWDQAQMENVIACFESVQAKGYYKFVGVKDKQGEFTSYDPTKVIAWMKDKCEHKKRKLRSELKNKFLKQWLEATSEEKSEILQKIGEIMPRQHWDALVEFFTSTDKQEEAERNKVNCASTQRPRAPGTVGGRTIVNTNYHLKQQNPQEYNPVKGWIGTHKGKDPASVSYREQFLEKTADMELGPDSPLTIITPILDSISGGHHGGYERGIGSGSHRRYTTTPAIHEYVFSKTHREATSQTETKMKHLEEDLEAERRVREEQASMLTAQASMFAAKLAEIEWHNQEEKEASNAKMSEMHKLMSAFFDPSRGF